MVRARIQLTYKGTIDSPRTDVYPLLGFSPAFDMFVEEMWVTVAGGGHLAVGTRQECRDAPGLPALWANRGVTVVNAVPTLIGIMALAQGVRGEGEAIPMPPSVRLINLGGEACPPALVSRLARPGLRLINSYGPSESEMLLTSRRTTNARTDTPHTPP